MALVDPIILIVAALFGAVFGSFANVVVHRGPVMWGLVDAPRSRGSLARPRSYCPHCKAPITPLHLIPIISFIVLRGRCASCGEPISIRYPAVEIIGAVLAIASVAVYGVSWTAVMAAMFGLFLLTLAAIDLETGFLPDRLTIPLVFIGIAANAFGMFASLPDALIGAVAGGGVFMLISVLWRRLRGVDALGLGDAKLMAAMGAWTGWELLPIIVLIGSLASLAGVFLARMRGAAVGAKDAIPFGPGLAFGGFAALIGDALVASNAI